jgi:hypothetical protein
VVLIGTRDLILKSKKMKSSKSLYLALCAAFCVAVPVFFSISRPLDSDIDADKRARTLSVLSVCGGALDHWSREHDRAPTAQEGLSVLEMKVPVPFDGWGRPIIFKSVSSNTSSEFQVYSRGKNGVDENGDGDDMSYRSAWKGARSA